MTDHVDGPGHQHTAPDHASRSAGPIPVVRLDTARRADGTFDETFLAGLRTALHEIGFLQLTDYGATPGQIGELTAAAARFFAPFLDRHARTVTVFPTAFSKSRLDVPVLFRAGTEIVSKLQEFTAPLESFTSR